MGKGWRLVSVVATGLVVAWVGMYLIDWIRGPTSEQRAAVTSLRMPPQPPGRNAWALLWSGDFDVTGEQAQRFYAEDLRRLPAWLRTATRPADKDDDWPEFEREAARRATPLVPLTRADADALCGYDAGNCLERVRDQRGAVHALLERHARRLARVEALSSYDLFWSDVPADPLAPFPIIGHFYDLWNTAAASRFIDGEYDRGLATACVAALTMRRMHAGSNTLIGTLVMDTGFRRSARLVADMLAELPAANAVPAVCRDAFDAPTLADVDYAALAANEWNFLRLSDSGWPKRPWHPEYIPAMGVGAIVALRDGAAAKAMLNDGVFDPATHMVARPDALQRLVHPYASGVIKETASKMGRYIDRGADFVATIRVTRLLLWLRDHPSNGPLAYRLASAPDALGLPLGRAPVIGCEGRCLELRERVVLGDAQVVWPVQPYHAPAPSKRLYCPRPRAAGLPAAS